MRLVTKIFFSTKNIFLKSVLPLLVFFSTNRVDAQQDTAVLTLDEILLRMDSAYPALLQYNQQLQAVQSLAQGAKSWMPPVVSIGMERFGYQPSMWGEQSPMNQAAVTVSATQMIPNPKKLDAGKNSVLAQAASLHYDSAWLRNDLRSRARLYYDERVVAEKKLAVVFENEKIIDMLIATAEKRYSVNQSDLATIFKAKAKKAELKNMEAMLLSEIDESTIGLNTLMNRNVNTPFKIDTAVTGIKNFPDTSGDSLAGRSDILAMDAAIYSMKQQQAYMKTGNKPDFGVTASHMQMLGMPNQFSVMGMMVIPIAPWSSGMYRSEVRAMDFRIADMQLEKEKMQLMARQMAAEKFVMLKYEMQQLNNYDSLIIPAYKDNYDAAFLSYSNNTGNFFLLLDAWDMLLMKKMEREDELLKVLSLQVQYEYETEN